MVAQNWVWCVCFYRRASRSTVTSFPWISDCRTGRNCHQNSITVRTGDRCVCVTGSSSTVSSDFLKRICVYVCVSGCAIRARVELSDCDEAEDGEEEWKSVSQPHPAARGAHSIPAPAQQHLQARNTHIHTCGRIWISLARMWVSIKLSVVLFVCFPPHTQNVQLNH